MIHYLMVYYVTVYRMPADSYLLRENDRRLEMSEITNEIKKRRTFAIISHPDAGKTTAGFQGADDALFQPGDVTLADAKGIGGFLLGALDRKSTRLNSVT